MSKISMITTLQNPCLDISRVKSKISNLKTRGFKIVLVTGVFDVLHAEHYLFLQAAKSAGDYLLVGVEADRRVRAMKGKGRPVYPQNTRLENLTKLTYIDHVFLLPEKFDKTTHHDRLIGLLKPDILAISSHTSHQIEKQTIMSKHGGKLVVVHPHNPNISSTQLIQRQK